MTAKTGVCMKCGAIVSARELRDLSIGQTCQDETKRERRRAESARLAAR